jgi:hypothetical protein
VLAARRRAQSCDVASPTGRRSIEGARRRQNMAPGVVAARVNESPSLYLWNWVRVWETERLGHGLRLSG